MENYSTERLNALFAIESLRAGVPTRISTHLLPDLRSEITQTIREDFQRFDPDNIPKGRLIWGQYGQGKTHMLTTIEHTALDLGFAVSMVSLSREVSCHDLFRFYGRLAPRIRIPNSTSAGIQKALNQKLASDLPESQILDSSRYVHPLPSMIFEDYFYAFGEDQDKLYSDLMGVRIPIPEFKRIHRACRNEALPKFEENFRIKDHAGAYFGVMSDAIRFCGYKGWVILIDEVELMGRLGRVSRLKAYRNLNWLLNWSGTMNYPIYTLAAAATRLQDDTWYSGKNPDRSSMPGFAYERIGQNAEKELKAFFDIAISNESLTVMPAREESLVQLLSKVAELHGEAYNWSPNINVQDVIRHSGSQPVRTYIRATLESLDLQHTYPSETTSIVDVTELDDIILDERDY